MKNLLITIMLSSLILGSISQETEICYSYKHFTGLVGNDSIEMDLILSKGTVHGSAVYTHTLVQEGPFSGFIKTERLEGEVDARGLAIIEGYGLEGDLAEYSGTLNKVFKGTKRIRGRNIASSFRLQEDYSGSIQFTGYCLERDSSLIDSTGSPHANIELYLFLPDTTGGNQYMKDAIVQVFLGKKDGYTCSDDSILYMFSEEYFSQYIESNIYIFSDGHSFNWEMTGSSDISLNRKGLLVYRCDNYAYTGGAHGIGISRFLVFDTREKKLLRPDDIFISGYEEILSKKLEAEYRQRYFLSEDESLTDAGLFDNYIHTSENFWISENGISFYYNPYELAPYAMGSITISLKHTDIQELLLEDAAVRRLDW